MSSAVSTAHHTGASHATPEVAHLCVHTHTHARAWRCYGLQRSCTRRASPVRQPQRSSAWRQPHHGRTAVVNVVHGPYRHSHNDLPAPERHVVSPSKPGQTPLQVHFCTARLDCAVDALLPVSRLPLYNVWPARLCYTQLLSSKVRVLYWLRFWCHLETPSLWKPTDPHRLTGCLCISTPI